MTQGRSAFHTGEVRYKQARWGGSLTRERQRSAAVRVSNEAERVLNSRIVRGVVTSPSSLDQPGLLPDHVTVTWAELKTVLEEVRRLTARGIYTLGRFPGGYIGLSVSIDSRILVLLRRVFLYIVVLRIILYDIECKALANLSAWFLPRKIALARRPSWITGITGYRP